MIDQDRPMVRALSGQTVDPSDSPKYLRMSLIHLEAPLNAAQTCYTAARNASAPPVGGPTTSYHGGGFDNVHLSFHECRVIVNVCIPHAPVRSPCPCRISSPSSFTFTISTVHPLPRRFLFGSCTAIVTLLPSFTEVLIKCHVLELRISSQLRSYIKTIDQSPQPTTPKEPTTTLHDQSPWPPLEQPNSSPCATSPEAATKFVPCT